MARVSKWFKDRRVEISNMIKRTVKEDERATSAFMRFLHDHVNSAVNTEQHLIWDEDVGAYFTPDGAPLGSGDGGIVP